MEWSYWDLLTPGRILAGGIWGNCAAGLYPIIVYSVANVIVDPILVTFGQICNFRDPNLVTFYFYELTHFLDWKKNTSQEKITDSHFWIF